MFWCREYAPIAGAVLPTEAAITLEAFLTGLNWLLTRNTHRKEDRRHRNVDRVLIHLLELLNKLIEYPQLNDPFFTHHQDRDFGFERNARFDWRGHSFKR